MELALSAMVGLLLGFILTWLVLRSRTSVMEAERSLMQRELLAS